MKKLKFIFKVAFVFLTIIGLVGSYLLFGHTGTVPGVPSQSSHQQASATEQLPIAEEEHEQMEEPVAEELGEELPLQDALNELESAEEEPKEPEVFHLYE